MPQYVDGCVGEMEVVIANKSSSRKVLFPNRSIGILSLQSKTEVCVTIIDHNVEQGHFNEEDLDLAGNKIRKLKDIVHISKLKILHPEDKDDLVAVEEGHSEIVENKTSQNLNHNDIVQKKRGRPRKVKTQEDTVKYVSPKSSGSINFERDQSNPFAHGKSELERIGAMRNSLIRKERCRNYYTTPGTQVEFRPKYMAKRDNSSIMKFRKYPDSKYFGNDKTRTKTFVHEQTQTQTNTKSENEKISSNRAPMNNVTTCSWILNLGMAVFIMILIMSLPCTEARTDEPRLTGIYDCTKVSFQGIFHLSEQLHPCRIRRRKRRKKKSRFTYQVLVSLCVHVFC
jgi:hypothetical protein